MTSDALHELWTQTKYPTEETAIPIATGEEALLIRAEAHRSQARNREDAVARLVELIRAAMRKPKRRIPTRPTRASQRRRVEGKKARGAVKALRKGPDSEV